MEALLGAMVDYFVGERAQAWVWLAIGLVMAVVALVLRRGLWRPASIPIAVFALLQLGIGIWLLITSDRRLDAVRHANLPADAAAFADAELTRMRGVATLFLGARLVEVALLVAGVAMLAAGLPARSRARPRRPRLLSASATVPPRRCDVEVGRLATDLDELRGAMR